MMCHMVWEFLIKHHFIYGERCVFAAFHLSPEDISPLCSDKEEIHRLLVHITPFLGMT